MDEFVREVKMLDKFRCDFIVHFFGCITIPLHNNSAVYSFNTIHHSLFSRVLDSFALKLSSRSRTIHIFPMRVKTTPLTGGLRGEVC